MNLSGGDLANLELSIYFMHLQKCAGTTLRLIFENAYPADKIMAAHSEIYYGHELVDYKSLQQTYSLYRGHFGWTLPAMLPNREWSVFTVLREPVDRLLSLYYYRKQHNRLPTSLSLESWLDDKLLAKDTMTSYFLSDVAGLTSRGSVAIPDLMRTRLPEALANLEKCRAVGISEALDDTINLFSWRLGILPPQRTARYNPTLNRLKSSDFSGKLRSKMERLLECDLMLYQKGCEMFHAARYRMAELVAEQAGGILDTSGTRTLLRANHTRRFAMEMSAQPLSRTVTWDPRDVFLGENLHVREQHGGENLRWTGPGERTLFTFYLGAPRKWSLQLHLHRATPPSHALNAQLWVNGVLLPFDIKALAGGDFLLQAAIPEEIAALGTDGVSAIEITTPIIRGENEFRMLGIALKSISFEQSALIEKPHSIAEERLHHIQLSG